MGDFFTVMLLCAIAIVIILLAIFAVLFVIEFIRVGILEILHPGWLETKGKEKIETFKAAWKKRPRTGIFDVPTDEELEEIRKMHPGMQRWWER